MGRRKGMMGRGMVRNGERRGYERIPLQHQRRRLRAGGFISCCLQKERGDWHTP